MWKKYICLGSDLKNLFSPMKKYFSMVCDGISDFFKATESIGLQGEVGQNISTDHKGILYTSVGWIYKMTFLLLKY